MSLIFLFSLNFISIFVFTVYNPVYAAFWLILTFFLSAIVLWLFNSKFFALIYLIIYVGAIAVLFLFVIMMLDIKILNSFKKQNINFYKQGIVYFIFLFVSFLISIVISNLIIPDNIFEFEENLNNTFDLVIELQSFGQVLYNNYIFCVLLGGLILFVAIIGAIILTLNLNTTKQNKLTARQLARSENFLTFLK